MRRLFARNFIMSAAAHVLIVAALLVLSFFSCRVRPGPREITTFIDLQVAPPVEEGPPPVVQQDVPAAPAPKAIEVSRRVVTRDQPRPARELTSERIREMLGAEDEPEPRPDAAVEEFSEYLAYVRAVMYQAWRQPLSLSGGRGLVARARIRIRSDGSIIERAIIDSAGNELMDTSVMTALEAVGQLRPLPPGRGSHEDVTINFQLTQP